MKTALLTMAVLATVSLAATTAFAEPWSHGGGPHAVAYPRGNARYGAYQGYYQPHPVWRRPVYVAPPPRYYPPMACPAVVYPSAYDYGRYGPSVGIQYQSPRFGCSIGF